MKNKCTKKKAPRGSKKPVQKKPVLKDEKHRPYPDDLDIYAGQDDILT